MLAVLLMLAALDKPPPGRAEVCHAHVMILIEDTMAETGRVAGPSWFIRDWWAGRLSDAERAEARQAGVQARVRAGATADAESFAAERQDCIDEAIAAGAVPGLG